MTRRLHPCRICPPPASGRFASAVCRGLTRHADRVCSRCRARSRSLVITTIVTAANPAAPTLAELLTGTDLSPFIAGMTWHGTDCPCAKCARDRIPGRHA